MYAGSHPPMQDTSLRASSLNDRVVTAVPRSIGCVATHICSRTGAGAQAKVIRNKNTQKSMGFGFVSFKDPWDMTKVRLAHAQRGRPGPE